jgi:Cu2+-exporting ATPase
MIQSIARATSLEKACRHCGADLFGAGLAGENEDRFCCEGCRVVYGLLSGAGEGAYYDLLKQSGVRAPRATVAPAYRAYLETLRDPAALRGIGRWEQGTHAVTLECPDLQCAACGWLMERLLGQTPGMTDYEVDFIHGEMHVRYDAGQVLLPEVLESLGRYGYAFKPKISREVRPALDRAAWMRLAVAAACFMNAMAFALGPYLGFPRGMDADWSRVLSWWSFASAVPAVVFSAWPFYQGAWRALRGRSFTIDVTVTIGIALAFTASLASVVSGALAGAAAAPDSFNFSDTLAGLVFFLLLGRYAVRRFEGGLLLRNRWHEALSPDRVRSIGPDGKMEWKPLTEVKAGDLIEVAADEYLPIDGNAVSGPGQVDTAFLTGEDRPRPFEAGDFLFAGYRALGGPSGGALRVRVVNPHAVTRAAGLRAALESLTARKRERHVRRERVALAFTLTIVAAALATLFLHWHRGWDQALFSAAAVFIVSCSCALALAVPISRGIGLLRAHRLGFHFKSQETLENLADVRSVLFDKTGTLTFTRRTLEAWEWAADFPSDPESRERVLRAVGRLAGMSAHPVALALHENLASGRGSGDISGFTEIPHFGLAGAWHESGGGEGRPETGASICLCRYGAWKGEAREFRALGLQVPEVPETHEASPPSSCVFVNGKWAASIRLGEEIKPGVRTLLQGLSKRGIRVGLLSGDLPARVAVFAEACGFATYQGGLSPEQKQAEARSFQEKHGRALAVGDGYNDSLLFGEAAISLAVQGSAGPVAAGSDLFMTSADPGALLDLLRVAEGTRRSIRNCYLVSGFYNAGAVSLAVAGLVSPLTAAILMPIASLSLCLTAWITVPRPRQSGVAKPETLLKLKNLTTH